MNVTTVILNDWLTSDRAALHREEPDDLALIDRFLESGAEECFERLVDRYKDRVFRLAASVMGPGFSAEAEDITQDVFLQVFRKLPTFRRESRFATWLFRITYRRALERKRRARFRIPHREEEVLDALEAPADQASPVISAEQRQRHQAVLKSVEALAEPYRTALYLHYWMNASIPEIAEHLGTRPGTVKSYLFRGRKRLARMLGDSREHG